MDNEMPSITLNADMIKVINFALQQNRIPVIHEISINNTLETPLENVTLSISTGFHIIEPYERTLQYVLEGENVLKDITLQFNAEALAQNTERITDRLIISLKKKEEEIASISEEITILAYDEWHGALFFPELIAAFVTPNHPEVIKIMAAASALLGKWTGNPSLDGYQSRNPNRVKQMAAAVYGALQKENITYAVPPASFEIIGQRVRLCDAVIQQHLGTCLDLTLFYVACLEAMGLHPLVFLMKGHIFAGVWLEEFCFPEAVQDDFSLITKRLADGVNEIAVVECTAFVAESDFDFDQAEAKAKNHMQSNIGLESMVDIFRARMSGIRPLPLRIQTDNGWKIESEKREDTELTYAPKKMLDTIVVEENSTTQTSKKLQWERKLLDLGLRNALINMRPSKNMIPILSLSLEELEEALSNGSEFGIMPRPLEWEQKQENFDFETIHQCGPYAELIQGEFKNKRLRSVFSEGELTKAIITLYRNGKVSLEENGANTLYLSLGLLRWYESKASEKARYAPIVLMPMEIVRRSANKGYVIRMRDEDAQMNITLLEMLKQDFGITIGGLDPLPQKEQGIDIRTVLTVVRRAVMGQPRWDVLESAFLGIFSFTQFVMWNDIRNRSEDLEKNKIVKSLMEGRFTWSIDENQLTEEWIEDDVFLPIPADASQLSAIRSASKEESFVLHGPPGTGKSQTITALIANALAQKKTVLFVAEKMAALSVVQKRLADLGIGPFCLELHSNKSSKRNVLEQLKEATEITRQDTATNFESKAEQAAELRFELSKYAKALHQTRHCGMSLFELISCFEMNIEADDTVCFSNEFAKTMDSGKLQKHKILLEQLVAAAKAIGHPYQHPLRCIGREHYSQQLQSQVSPILSAYQKALEQLQTSAKQFANVIAFSQPEKIEEWKYLVDIGIQLTRWKDIPMAWAKSNQLYVLLEAIKTTATNAAKTNEKKKELLQNWTPDFLLQEGAALLQKWKEASSQWFLPKMLEQNKILKIVKPFAKENVQKEMLSDILLSLTEYQQLKEQVKETLSSCVVELDHLYQGEETNWEKIQDLCAVARESGDILRKLTGSDEVRLQYAARPNITKAAMELEQSWIAMEENRKAFYELLEWKEDSNRECDWVMEEWNHCKEIAEHMNSLREWMVYRGICREVAEIGLQPVLEAYHQGTAHEIILSSYSKGMYRALILLTMEEEPELEHFSGAVFQEKINQFKKIDKELAEVTKQEIFYRLAAQVPDFTKTGAQSSELGILQRAIRSGGRGVSIRRLFEQIPNLLPRLCPCMLMSPISAAQYLDPKREPFDIVVFDEASQLPTCKAVGVLARGKNAVVVGDPNQMPPTSFFGSITVDEDNLETEDLESILDDCLAINMPQTHLLWHYRSRHESLITFSNCQFYDNKLFTFPSVNDRESKVTFIKVNGFFDRGKTRRNHGEAKEIVKELIRRSCDAELKNRSVGVVTFNSNQQNLIDDLFTEACKTNPQLEEWASRLEEPLFIKNLENVQGDERDVILFSVGYGPDAEGKVSMNFGPLNREGGWRRLNVAVSRARYEMVVFSTLLPEQINLSRTSAKGVRALKEFLTYAQNGLLYHDTEERSSQNELVSAIADSICRFLEQEGYQAQKSIGRSQFQIDVGVVDPREPNRYLLGILLDGKSYKNANTVRDREIAQIDVLHGLGWDTYRIWSLEWWNNSQKIKEDLLRKLEELKSMSMKKENLTPIVSSSQQERIAVIEKELDVLFQNRTIKQEQNKSIPLRKTDKSLKDMNHIVLGEEKEFQRVAEGFQSQQIMAQHEKSKPLLTYKAVYLQYEALSAEEYILPQSVDKIKMKIDEVLKAEAPISEGLLTKRILQSYGISRAGVRVQEQNNRILDQMRVKATKQNGTSFFWYKDQIPEKYQGFRPTGEGNDKREAKDIPMQEAANAVCAVLDEQIGLPKEDLVKETAKKFGYTRTGPLVATAMELGIDYALKDKRIQQDSNGNLTLRS